MANGLATPSREVTKRGGVLGRGRGGWLAFFGDLSSAAWQRCRTHCTTNLMSVTPKSSWPWVRTLLHSIFDQPDAESVVAQYDRVLDALSDKLPKVAEHLDAARDELLAFTAFPKQIWRQIWSNNPLSVNRPSGDTSRVAA